MPADTQAMVSVRAAGRLHLGFLDPSGTLGRRYGGLGLMVEGFDTELELRAADVDSLSADGAAAEAQLPRLAAGLQRLREHTGRNDPLALRLRRVPPAHAGFGSGTQLALALGRGFAAWQRLDLPSPRLAQWLGRGQRSGIGIAGFDQGGLLVDGGPGDSGAPAALLSRLAWPEAWRIVVVLDPRNQGLSGAAERHAMATLPALPQAAAADLCHQVLMRVLPGVVAAEFGHFAAGINRVQERLGEHFAPAQAGGVWTSAAVGRLMAWLHTTQGDSVAIGQSSWGPTGFAIAPSATAAVALVEQARAAGAVDDALELRIVNGNNRCAAVARHAGP